MRTDAAIHALCARAQRPLSWIVPISFAGLLWVLVVILQSLFRPGPGWLRTFSLGMVVLAGVGLWVAMLAPVAWQWTGDERSDAGLLRGALQSLILTMLGSGLLAMILVAVRLKGGGALHLARLLRSASPGIAVLFCLQMLGYSIARWERLAEDTKRSMARARELQWMSHRGTFSPALLFNNLEHLSGQVLEDPRGTEHALLDLADLYRKWLMEAEQPLIPWGRERAITEQFLALEGRRCGGRMKVRWRLEPDLEPRMVPPLILIPFLEAILGANAGGAVSLEISAAVREALLEILIQVEPAGSDFPGALLAQTRLRIQTALGTRGGVFRDDMAAGSAIRLRFPSPEPGGRP